MANGTVSEAVALFKSWKGLNETTKHAQTQKKIINPYNKISGRKLDCKTTPWCQIAVVSCLYQAGLKKYYVTAGCKQAVSWYKNKKRWKAKSAKPQVGWQIFYDFKGKGSPTHTGLVIAVSGNTVTVEEGNKSNAVGPRKFNYKTYKYIYGYGQPYYLTAKTETKPAEPAVSTPAPEPVVEPTPGPVVEPVAEPVVSEPVVTEPVVEPAPAPTPAPAAPAKPATSGFKSYKVQVTPKAGLNIRKGPGISYRKVGALAHNAKATILAKSGCWGRIGSNKWINLNYVKKI